jgi:xanthine dehydrogenase accessory factor
MSLYTEIQSLDKHKTNIVITILNGIHAGEHLLLSDGIEIYKSNDKVDWEPILNHIPLQKKSQTLTINNQMVFYEFIQQNYKVVICGAGHISMSLIRMCRMLNLYVTVIDDRPFFADNARKEGADKVICEPFVEALTNIKGDTGTFFIIVTRGHRYDQVCLEHIIEKENSYIGMIGSKVRVKKVLEYLITLGIAREKLEQVYTPIGLKIGAETPAEIAVAIMAQIIEIKNKNKTSDGYTEEIISCLSNDSSWDLPRALVTIVSRKGSAPREVGTKMIVLADGTMIGTIGGGCVESDIRQEALNCIRQKECRLVVSDMTGINAEEEGMVCGGIIELFIEYISA